MSLRLQEPPVPSPTLVVPRESGRITERRRQDAPIESWISFVEGKVPGPKPKLASGTVDGSASVIGMLDCIALCERHPIPADSDDVDYKAIYESISCLMCGEVPKDLNKASSQKLLKMMGKLLRTVDESKPFFMEQREYLAKYREPEQGVAPMSQLNVLKLPMSFINVSLDSLRERRCSGGKDASENDTDVKRQRLQE